MSAPQYLTPDEVAERWRCSAETVRRGCRRKVDPIPHFRDGGIVRIDLADLERYEQARTRGPARRLRSA